MQIGQSHFPYSFKIQFCFWLGWLLIFIIAQPSNPNLAITYECVNLNYDQFMKRSKKPWNIVFINNYKRNNESIFTNDVYTWGGGGLMFVHWFNVSLYVCRSTQVFNGAVTRSSRKRSMYHLEGRLHTLFHILTILM